MNTEYLRCFQKVLVGVVTQFIKTMAMGRRPRSISFRTKTLGEWSPCLLAKPHHTWQRNGMLLIWWPGQLSRRLLFGSSYEIKIRWAWSPWSDCLARIHRGRNAFR